MSQNDTPGDTVGRDKATTNIYEAPPPILNLHQLPSPPRDFTGREAELAELLAQVKQSGVTLTSLRGLGGIGKTALALKLAEQLTEQYPDAQFYLDLQGASQKPLAPAEAMAHVIRAYHPTASPPADVATVRSLYCSVLHNQRALLLMDNVANREQVEPLLPPASCLLLVTSRQHFTLPGMYAKDLDVMPKEDAQALLLKIAPRLGSPLLKGEGAACPDRRLGVVRSAAETLAELCGYLPLALRLSASALAEREGLSPADYIRRLEDTAQRLKLTGAEASLTASYDLLTPDMQKLWRMLAVFPASFDRAAAVAVWQLETDPCAGALSDMVRFSLVGWDAAASRYYLHDLARLFAGDRLDGDEQASARQRHAAHYAAVLRSADELYEHGGESIPQGLALFNREWLNIQAGQAWAEARAGKDDAADRLCDDYPDAGAHILNLHQHRRERIHWLQVALAAARRLGRSTEGKHLSNLGSAYRFLGEYHKAIEYFKQCLVIARDAEHGDREGESTALGNLRAVCVYPIEYRKAIEYGELSLAIAREICAASRSEAEQSAARRGEGKALGTLGSAYHSLGDVDNIHQAIGFYEQHLTITREIGDRREEGYALGNLGSAYFSLGEYHKAIGYYEQYLAIAREIGDRGGEGTARWNLSRVMDKLGERAQAIAHAADALKILEQIKSPDADMLRKQLAEWRGQDKEQ